MEKVNKMTQIDTSNWGGFRVGDLFETVNNNDKQVPTGANVPSQELKSGTVPRISVTGVNNGVVGYYDSTHKNYKVYNNFISVNFLGNAFYQENNASLDMKVHCLKLKNKELNKYLALFLVAIINKLTTSYSYANQLSSTSITQLQLPLPITPEGTPDFDYMENYMKNLETVAIKRVEKLKEEKPQTKIDTSNWKKFKVGDLFECNIAKSLDFGKLEKGNTIFIGRTSTNNGVQGKVNAPPCEKGNCITVGMVGDNKAFYQPQEFAASQNILVLRNKRLNEKNGLFFAALINSLLTKYNYSNTVKKKEFINESILLPITPEGTPDFDYMENYMKNIEDCTNNIIEQAKKKI